MFLKSLKIKSFRCFDSFETDFKKGINVLYGLNAVGKTSLLESINYLVLTKSFKTSDEMVLVKDGSEFAIVTGTFESDVDSFSLKIYKDSLGKTVFKNNNKFSKISEYIGESLVVNFSNEDLHNLNKSSRERRKIFEPVFCQISKEYVNEYNYYRKVLNERNALLKRLIFENNESLNLLLKTLDYQLVESGKKIMVFRKSFVDKIKPLLVKNYKMIIAENEDVELVYKSSCSIEDFEKRLEDNKSLDLKKGTTSVGPHRDDYVFIINNKNIIDYGSQGQQRSFLIGLKIAFVDLLCDVKKEYPILLLDDVLSELDVERQNNLFNGINKNIQTIMSTATLSEVNKTILDNANIITLKKEM